MLKSMRRKPASVKERFVLWKPSVLLLFMALIEMLVICFSLLIFAVLHCNFRRRRERESPNVGLLNLLFLVSFALLYLFALVETEIGFVCLIFVCSERSSGTKEAIEAQGL